MLDLVECGSTIVEAAAGTSVTRFVSVPNKVTHLAYVCGMAYDSVGREVAIHQEVSWVDATVGGSVSTSNFRIPIIRDLAGVALIDSFYFAGLSGWGEPVRYSYDDPDMPMRLFINLATAPMASGGAFVRVQWGRRRG